MTEPAQTPGSFDGRLHPRSGDGRFRRAAPPAPPAATIGALRRVAGASQPLSVVIGTANPGKVPELRRLVAAETGGGIRLVQRPLWLGDVEETADTFVGNARLKALAVARAAGAPALADDSGIEVDALGGRPGVFSARYGGPGLDDAGRAALLLDELAAAGAVSKAARRARFRAVVVLAWPDGEEIVAEGTVEGRIAGRPAGGGGFGYDPVFVPYDGDGRTLAEMDDAEKDALSHRGRALRALADALASAG